MDPSLDPTVASVSAIGFVGGLVLLARGMRGYRTSARIADTSTSRISAIAAGEVRVSGVIEPAEVLLVSLLQSVPCVYYRATISDEDGGGRDDGIVEERSIGFRVRDGSGSLRVFPRGGHIDAPARFDERSGMLGDSPPGLAVRVGDPFQAADPSPEAAVAALLTVRPAGLSALATLGGSTNGRRRFRELRLEPGDEVTVVGRALPFADLDDPASADLGLDDGLASLADDPEIAASIAAARAAGTLETDPEEAWGNAAIPGFGIGRPVRAPELDPAANPLPLATADEAAHNERRFEIAPEDLVVAASAEVPLLIAHGTPGAAAARQDDRFLVGLLGAALAIASAMVFAVMLSGGFA